MLNDVVSMCACSRLYELLIFTDGFDALIVPVTLILYD